MYNYTNSLDTMRRKNTDAYLNDAYQKDTDKNYRWQLQPLIGKTVRIESLQFNIEDKTLKSDSGEYNVKLILMENAHIVRVSPYNDEKLPIVLNHIWVMVGNDFEADAEYNKISIKGTVNEYIKSSGTTDVGIDAISVKLNNGKDIVVPSKYTETSEDSSDKQLNNDNISDIRIVPEEFSELIFSARDCEMLGIIEAYGNVSWNGEDGYKVPYAVLKNFGGAFRFKKLYDKMRNIKFKDAVAEYLYDTENNYFNISNLSVDETKKYFGKINPDNIRFVPDDKDSYSVKCYSRKHFDYNYDNWAEIISNMPIYNQKEKGNIARALEQNGYITIEERYIGTYEAELAAYNDAVEKQKIDIEKIRKEYPNSKLKFEELVPPENHDFTYYVGIPTEKGRLLAKWFGYEIAQECVPDIINEDHDNEDEAETLQKLVNKKVNVIMAKIKGETM